MSKLIIGEKTQKSISVLCRGKRRLLDGKEEMDLFLSKEKNWNRWVHFQRDRLGLHIRPS